MLLERMWRSLVTCARNRKPLSQPRAGRTGESDDESGRVPENRGIIGDGANYDY